MRCRTRILSFHHPRHHMYVFPTPHSPSGVFWWGDFDRSPLAEPFPVVGGGGLAKNVVHQSTLNIKG